MLTQAELLAEAAYTELDNLASLQLLMAREEESKKRAMVVKKKYSGPSLKYKSRRVDEEALVGGAGRMVSQCHASGYRAYDEPDCPSHPLLKDQVACEPGNAHLHVAPADFVQDVAYACAIYYQQLGVCGILQTTLELHNARQLPAWMRPRPAASHGSPICCVTGLPARYKDPKTGLFYANAASFRQIRQSAGLPVEQASLPAVPVHQPGMLSEDVAALLVDFFQQATRR